jgi:hypothetical protein
VISTFLIPEFFKVSCHLYISCQKSLSCKQSVSVVSVTVVFAYSFINTFEELNKDLYIF